MKALPEEFFKVEFMVKAAMADEAGGILTARGALGCAARWPIRARRSGQVPVVLEAFFSRITPAQAQALNSMLERAGMLSGQHAPRLSRMHDPGWATAWKSRFKPLALGQRLLIVPPWEKAGHDGRLAVVIDPGLGFGTGHHPTTRTTMLALEALCTPAPASALDVGTGSGILALAMRRLGVKRVTALDVDSQALDNARHNAELNRIGAIRFSTTPLERLHQPFPLIAANILSSVLSQMAPALNLLLAPGGHLILSGILKREAPALLRHYRPALRLVSTENERGWTTLVLTKPVVVKAAPRAPIKAAPRARAKAVP